MIYEMLRFKIDSIRQLGGHPGCVAVEEFLLEQGALWLGRSLPSYYRPMTPKQCFDNAGRLSVETGMTYVEGFAARGDLPMAFRHAWLIDDNQVVDPTWRDTDLGTEYLGIRVPRKLLLSEAMRNEHYGVLWSGPLDSPNCIALMALGGKNAVRHLRERVQTHGTSAAGSGGRRTRHLRESSPRESDPIIGTRWELAR